MKNIFLFLLAGFFYACSESAPEIKMKSQPFNVTATLAENGKDVNLVWTSVKNSGNITYSIKYGNREIPNIRDTVYTLTDLPYYSSIEGSVIGTNSLGESIRTDFGGVITDADPKDPDFKTYTDPTFESLLVSQGIDKKIDGRLYIKDTKGRTELQINDVNIDKNVISAFHDLRVLHLNGLNNNILDLSENTNLRELDITASVELKKIILPQSDKLEILRIRSYPGTGNLSTIDLSGNKNLKNIDLSGNKLENIDLTKNEMLESLDLTENKIKKINLTDKRHLKTLYLGKNYISGIDLSNAPKIEHLDISSNGLTEINLPSNCILNNLNLNSNPIKTLKNIPNTLKILSISYTKLYDFDFSSIPQIEVLSIEGLKLEEIDLSSNTQLFTLAISDNALSQLNLCNNFQLKGVLRCENNNLNEIWLPSGLKSGQFWSTDKGVVFKNCE